MTNPEFSNEFDVLYNNITSNQAPGLDEYEKSVFLTKAQDEILLAYFSPKGNKMQEGYDGSQIRQIDFSMVTKTVDKQSNDFSAAIYDPRSESKSVAIPTDILMVLNERLIVTRQSKTEYLTVVPIHFVEYDRLMSKPYKRPLKYQAWRIFNFDNSASKSDLVVGPGDVITKYSLRYVKRPNPIILSNLDGLTINGIGNATNCELDPILHKEILQRAVELAKASYTGDLTSQVTLGTTSQTNIGVVPQAR